MSLSYAGDTKDNKRALRGAKAQEEMKQAYEQKVRELREATDKSLRGMDLTKMFATEDNLGELKFKEAIIGLQTHEDYKSKLNKYLLQKDEESDEEEAFLKKKKRKRKRDPTISFDLSDEDDDSDSGGGDDDSGGDSVKKKKKKKIKDDIEGEEDVEDDDDEDDDEDDDYGDPMAGPPLKRRRKLTKNPLVDSSFLPDKERDAFDAALKKEFESEWFSEQERIKKERLEITYSYWDGSGHRRSIEITKGMKISQFLELARKELSQNFSELRGMTGSENLMYIKDDMIIPQNYTFYDLIVTNAKGKSHKVMFQNEKLLKGSYTIERDSGHPGKIITRAWYDRNKHIYPANMWKVYQPRVAP